MMGDKNQRFPRNTGRTIRFPSCKKGTRKDYDVRQGPEISGTPARPSETMVGDKDWRFPGPSAAPCGSPAPARKEATKDCDTRQGLAISRDPRQHHLVPRLQEGRQEESMMRDRDCRCAEQRPEEISWETWIGDLPGLPAAPSGSYATRRETRGDYDGSQGLAISGGHPAAQPGTQAAGMRQEKSKL